MGVTSLWEIMGPAARPVRLEALSRKKMAVDASIWIYQFLKAVRDSQGNAMALSHIVGFFRRICKLLYFGILPIFVFDGGAPALKRQTITKRKQRREGHRENATQAAHRLLAMQVQRQAEPRDEVFLEDLDNNHPMHKEKSPERFVKKDEYHLPNISLFKVSSSDMRIIPEEEFNEAAEYSFDHVDGVDINTVDPSSPEFNNFPIATQYMILSHLRLRSRLRMGFSQDQLKSLFPNSIDFSKFQIQQVQKRNFYTQRLMDVSGMGEDSGNVTKRIAGDKDRQYALVKNADGWTLQLGGDGLEPIPLDEYGNPIEPKSPVKQPLEPVKVELDDDIEWEDVSEGEKPETEEEKNVQKAIIESIYDQYAPKKTNNYDELKLAVEKTKKDLQVLKGQEMSMGISTLPKSIPAATESYGFDLLESFLFKPAEFNFEDSVLSQKTEKKEKKEIMEESDIEPLIAQDEVLKVQIEEPLSIQNEKQSRVDKKEDSSVDPAKENVGSQVQILDSVRDKQRQDIMEIEELAKDDEKEEPVVRPMPTWFDESVSQVDNLYEPEVSEVAPRKRKYQEDEEAGLISWNDAQEMFNRESPKSADEIQEIAQEEVEKNDEDVQEIQEVQEPQEVQEIQEITEPESPKNKRKAAFIDYDFEENDENELVEQLRTEEKEHEEFKQRIKTTSIPVSSLRVTNEQLLQEQVQKSKRDSDEVTQTMISDVQELLKRFGIPYITAPMEAEAQCAELMKLGLVDGIVTDDSDCFLFGGSRVYKNMFNQKQYVECYMMSDVEARLGLNQEKLIELALLLGSDYTEGIKGVGPVLAMEILAEFGSLVEFKKWYDKNTTAPNREGITSLQKNLLNRIKNGKLVLPESFPDSIVKQAYTNAEVDRDESEFKWGIPNLDQIRSFLMYNVNWTQSRVDEVLVPLVRDMNRKRAEGTQSTLGEFFPQETIKLKKTIGLGKRMQSATEKLNKRTNS